MKRLLLIVGGGKDISIDLRLVCATHQNIEADIEAGKFRADLFYRINVFPIKIPELAERAVDIPQIVEALKKAIEKQNEIGSPPDFDESAMQEFMRYTWPGNVRELRNVVERACLLFPGSKLEAKHIRDHLLRLRAPDPVEEQDALWAATADLGTSPPDDATAELTEAPLPHPPHYKAWFAFFDNLFSYLFADLLGYYGGSSSINSSSI